METLYGLFDHWESDSPVIFQSKLVFCIIQIPFSILYARVLYWKNGGIIFTTMLQIVASLRYLYVCPFEIYIWYDFIIS